MVFAPGPNKGFRLRLEELEKTVNDLSYKLRNQTQKTFHLEDEIELLKKKLENLSKVSNHS